MTPVAGVTWSVPSSSAAPAGIDAEEQVTLLKLGHQLPQDLPHPLTPLEGGPHDAHRRDVHHQTALLTALQRLRVHTGGRRRQTKLGK